MPQIQLPFFPHGATEINVNLAILREGDTVTYMYGHPFLLSNLLIDFLTIRGGQLCHKYNFLFPSRCNRDQR